MRTLIVAGSGAAAAAVRRVLRYAPTLQVIGWTGHDAAHVDAIRASAPALVIFDAPGDAERVVAGAKPLEAAVPAAKFVLLAADTGAATLSAAADAGFLGVVARGAHGPVVGMLIRELAAGNVFQFTRPHNGAARTAASATPLTGRELEILRLVAAGAPNGRIAAQLHIADQTVKFHLSNVYRKLGLSNRTAAAHYAHVHGLFTDASPGGDEPAVSVAA